MQHINSHINILFLNCVKHLGEDPNVIDEIVSGKHPLSKRLSDAKKPVIIVGADQLARKDGAAILSKLHDYANSLNKDVSEKFTSIYDSCLYICF